MTVKFTLNDKDSPATVGKWKRLGWHVTICAKVDADPISWIARVPVRCIGFRSLTKSQRKGNPDALRKARSTPVSSGTTQN